MAANPGAMPVKPGRAPIFGAPPNTGGTWAAPGKTALPKLRTMPADGFVLPPGKTTLPKLRCTWPNTLVPKARETTTASAFIGTSLTGLYRLMDRNGRRKLRPMGYFFFGAGASGFGTRVPGVADFGVAGAAGAGGFAGGGAPVPRLAWARRLTT